MFKRFNPLHAAINWGHVGVRAMLYGTLSVTVGPLTPKRRLSQWAMHQWCVGAVEGLKIRRHLYNGHFLDPKQQVIFIANHLSLLDILLLGSFLKDIDYRWLSKASIFDVPFLGWHLKIAGHIPVYRDELRQRNAALADRIHGVLDEGASLLFFPEGTRSPDGELKSFKIGAFRTAVLEKLPIQPLVIYGTGQLMRKGAIDLQIDQNRECSVTVLPPIFPPDGDTIQQRAELLRDTAWNAMYQSLSPFEASRIL